MGDSATVCTKPAQHILVIESVQCNDSLFSPLEIQNVDLVVQIYQEIGKFPQVGSLLHTWNHTAGLYHQALNFGPCRFNQNFVDVYQKHKFNELTM